MHATTNENPTTNPTFEDDAILSWELSEVRKDLAMLRVRIRMQRRAGSSELAAKLVREYQRAANRLERLRLAAEGTCLAIV